MLYLSRTLQVDASTESKNTNSLQLQLERLTGVPYQYQSCSPAFTLKAGQMCVKSVASNLRSATLKLSAITHMIHCVNTDYIIAKKKKLLQNNNTDFCTHLSGQQLLNNSNSILSFFSINPLINLLPLCPSSSHPSLPPSALPKPQGYQGQQQCVPWPSFQFVEIKWCLIFNFSNTFLIAI